MVVVTFTLPSAPAPTLQVISVTLTTDTSVAAIPPIVTVGVPTKLVPVMVISVPITPLLGEKLLIVVGGGTLPMATVPSISMQFVMIWALES